MDNTIVLIDDEKLTHLTWEMCLKDGPISLRSFRSIDDFIGVADQFSRTTKIFVDVNLGKGESGISSSKKIHDIGFSNIYLTTGFDSFTFTAPTWIKGVYPKDIDEILKTLPGAQSKQQDMLV